MNVLELAQKHGIYKRISSAKGGEYAGPCPVKSTCNGSGEDRFHIWPEQDDHGSWWCRKCEKGGDAIQFLMDVEGLSFPEACKALGKELPEQQEMRTPQMSKPSGDSWQPKTPAAPAGLWREHAEKFLAWTQQQLIDLGEGPGTPLYYLAGRGIRKETAIKFGLGWNPGEKGKDCYRAREAWGLDTILKDGKKKKLWLPIGLVIPFLSQGVLRRLRIRIPKDRRTPEFSTPYFIVPGSAMDTFVTTNSAKAYVIIEAELDAILVAQEATGLQVGAMAMGNSSAKPTAAAEALLAATLHIANALDYDFREENKENPGGVAWLWWKKQFPQAERWPVPVGKDPGDAWQAGVNIREWVTAGLPPFLTLPPAVQPAPNGQKQNIVVDDTLCGTRSGVSANKLSAETPTSIQVEYIQGKSKGGHLYFITESGENRSKLAEKFPGKAIFTHSEILLLKGLTPEQAEKFIIIKETFGPDAEILFNESV